MDRILTSTNSHAASATALETMYTGRRIPPEKKPFLIDLARSTGPLMQVQDGDAILDVASQIASLALGFNPGVAFGTAEFLESWTGREDSAVVRTIRRSLAGLLARQLGQDHVHMHVCHSGAEANEIALGMCYARRSRPAARHVVAFGNSFHGRMMAVLAATWNPAKREPFAWPECTAGFADYPEMPTGDDVAAEPVPDGWCHLWSQAPRSGFEPMVRQRFPVGDPLLDLEIDSLLQVRKRLLSGDYYAVLLEPMQCEGGDRYSTARFHNGLLNLCRACRVPLVYDEIQTGFGLGGDFFWHSKFNLTDHLGRPAMPDLVVSAKKAQVGLVLSRHPSPFPEEFNTASLIRGYIQASMIDQFREEIDIIQQRSRQELQNLLAEYVPHINRPRACGLSFAFDFEDPEKLKQFVACRFEHGLLYYPAGARAARFRFNLAFRGEWLDLAWQQIRAALGSVLGTGQAETGGPVTVPDSRVSQYYEFHQQMIDTRLRSLSGEPAPPQTPALDFAARQIREAGLPDLQLVRLDEGNWPAWRERVEQIQEEIYEPLRRTPIVKFDRLIAAENAVALLACLDNRIVSMAFAAPPSHFPAERGLRLDERFDDPRALYMLDLTVLPGYRGQLGRIMKQTVCLVASQAGMSVIIGRNRDRLARGMWAINLSLGSYGTRVIREDYMDEHAHRDCQMYHCDLQWSRPPLRLDRAVSEPMGWSGLTRSFVQQGLPALVNKLTLSNFVTADYLDNLAGVFALLPGELRHGYTASGISECVDKLVKVLWLKRQPRRKLVTLQGSFFGQGSFLARSLSGTGEPYFPVEHLATGDDAVLLQDLEASLAADDVLAVLVEPLGWKSGRRISRDLLSGIHQRCSQSGTPLVYHDSGGLFYRWQADTFLPSASGGLVPAASLFSLGGQMALCCLRDHWFDDTPLSFISTWDGDAFSLARFAAMVRQIGDQRAGHEQLVEQFDRAFRNKLAENGVTDYDLNRGCGWLSGPVESDLAAALGTREDGRLVCLPSPDAMRQFVESA